MVTREPDVLGGVLGKSGSGRRGQHQHRPRQSAAGARGAKTGATTVSEGLTPTKPRCSVTSSLNLEEHLGQWPTRSGDKSSFLQLVSTRAY